MEAGRALNAEHKNSRAVAERVLKSRGFSVARFAMVALYDRRARYEEAIMQHDEAYRRYMAAVRFRFIPLLY